MSQNEAAGPEVSLATSLATESAAWQTLLTVLGEEEVALVEGEADALPRLSAAKMAQLRTLSTLARVRHDALIAAGLNPDQGGMEAWLGRPANAAHAPLWEALQLMEQRAQAMNQRIGVLIELRLNATRQALNVLVQAAKNQGSLYDQAGCSVTATKGKPLTAA